MKFTIREPVTDDAPPVFDPFPEGVDTTVVGDNAAVIVRIGAPVTAAKVAALRVMVNRKLDAVLARLDATDA